MFLRVRERIGDALAIESDLKSWAPPMPAMPAQAREVHRIVPRPLDRAVAPWQRRRGDDLTLVGIVRVAADADSRLGQRTRKQVVDALAGGPGDLSAWRP
jgi:hypothetical protein